MGADLNELCVILLEFDSALGKTNSKIVPESINVLYLLAGDQSVAFLEMFERVGNGNNI